MRVVFVNYGHLVAQGEPEQVLDDFHTLTGWAEALQAAGAEVIVVQGFHHEARLERLGVRYDFVAGRFAPRLSRWRIPGRIHRQVAESGADIVHLHGLLYAIQARDLRRRLAPSCSLVVQHHAERPSRRWVRHLQRWGLSSADAFFFNGRELAQPWLQKRLIRPDQPVFEVPEGSTRFRMADRAAARNVTGLEGRVVCLWLGNLDANKDPLTVLEGFEQILETVPDARLFMAYRQADQLSTVEARIAASPGLSRAVRLLGELSRDQVEAHLNSADFLLQGSRYEGSGYALIEALACGVIPVVTDIAAFRYITDRGSVGALWPQGQAEGLARELSRLFDRPLEPQRNEAVALFHRSLSYEAIARQAMSCYRELRSLRRPRRRKKLLSTQKGPIGGPYLCPECRQSVDTHRLTCSNGHRFRHLDGVLTLLSKELGEKLEAFRDGLREHRDHLDRRIFDEPVYDSLPFALEDDFEWRLRSYDVDLLRRLLFGRNQASVLDVGSYNGWLAHRLSQEGCAVTAVDFFDDPHDGLGARRFYTRADWCSVQMDLRDLSLLDRVFDVVILNRCLQFFEEPTGYLRHVQQKVAAGGLLVVTGLDFFRFPMRKRRAVERLQRRHRGRHGQDFFLHRTRGWLDYEDYRRLSSAGLQIHEVRQLRRQNWISRVRPDRPRFCYGVWVSQLNDEPGESFPTP